MRKAIQTMICEADNILEGGLSSVWLYGSVVMGDFRPGWSDIDFIAMTKGPISPAQAGQLLQLRQTLQAREPENPFYACLEGVIMPEKAYREQSPACVVNWGTTGQRLLDGYQPDAFAAYSLRHDGQCVYGEGERTAFPAVSASELRAAVVRHYETIRQHAVQTGEQIYSCGWLLDLSRCLYTLREGGVASKTHAAQWALEHHLCPDEAALRKTLAIRLQPLAYMHRAETKAWLTTLGPVIQRYADVLERELYG